MATFRVSEKQLRVLTAASAVCAVAALIYGYCWWTAPLTINDDGYGRPPIPAVLIVLVVFAVAGGWNACALWLARRVGESEIRCTPILVGEAVAIGPLLVTAAMMLAFANQAIPVWFYMFIGIPTLFVGLMIATTPPPLSSETALQRYLNEDAATVRRGRLRRRLAWGAAVVALVVGLIILVIGIPGTRDVHPTDDVAPESSATGFANIAGEFVATNKPQTTDRPPMCS